MQVLEEAVLNQDGSLPFDEIFLDEGRAMAELIHDIAPGARLLFHTGIASQVLFREAILDLHAAGADIIVDDLSTIAAPIYSDGLIAQAIDSVVAAGTTYFTVAGNQGNDEGFYEGPFESTLFSGLNVYDWEPGPGVSPFLEFNLDGEFTIDIQWDEPFASACDCNGAQTFNLFIFQAGTSNLLSLTSNVPGEARIVRPLAFGGIDLAMFLVQADDQQALPTRIKYQVTTEGNTSITAPIVPLDAPTLKGNNNAAGAIAVGASAWWNTPAGAALAGFSIPQSPLLAHTGVRGPFIRNGQILTTRSALSGSPILLDADGNRLPEPLFRESPAIVAPDAGQTSFFGDRIQGIQNPFFFGTSAAAPNAAAVAALLLQASNNSLSPEEIRSYLTSTAIDMDNPYDNGLQEDPNDPDFSTGFDFASGHGLVQADAAVEALIQDLGLESFDMEAVCREGNDARFSIDNPNGYGYEVPVIGQRRDPP